MSAPVARPPSRPLDSVSLALLAAIVAFLLVDLAVLATTPFLAPRSAVVRELSFSLSWIGVGVVAMWLRRDELARRILALALVLAADFVGSFGLIGTHPALRFLVTLTALLVPLQTAFAGHLLLAYPSGVVHDSAGRRLVVFGYVLGLLEGVWWVLTHVSMIGSTCAECAQSYRAFDIPAAMHQFAAFLFATAWVGAALVLVGLLVVRYRRSGHRQRRLLRLPYLSILAAVVLFSALSALAAPQGVSAWGLSPETLLAMQLVTLLGVPLCFLIGLLHERLAYKRIGELVVSLAGSREADLEHSLAVALGDPQLRVSFPVADGYVDTQGRPATAPEEDVRTAVTAVGEDGAPMALIRHDRSLSDEPALLTAAGSATRLILENARLQAEVRAQLLEVRESRARIVTATNEARARLERDLHDGAQQRLLAVGIALQLLRRQPGDQTLIDAADEELSSALVEMRELASGIHPAVLTDLGLAAALDTLVRRLGDRVVLERTGDALRRMPAPVEAAAYFATSEALTNALKHADATRVGVRVEDLGDRLSILVSDDGSGGADPSGTGLLGIRDRIAAVDGTLRVDSPPGRGTVLEMELPCA
jgi:signal transduction histidine kinase